MKFFLDGTLIADEPNGDIITSIRRDQTLGGFVVTNDAQLKWEKSGYVYIQSIIEANGFCGEIECEIHDDCTGTNTIIFKGKIFILEIRKDTNCIITAPLQDNSYYARINKNKSIKITIDTTRSKNNVEIEAAKENIVEMFAPSTGTALANDRTLYRVYDVFKNMVAFMSDGEVAFDSNLFGLGGEFEGLSVGTGLEIAFPSGNNPITDSFDNFFKEVRKKINCTFYIDSTGITPTLRVERYSDLFDSTVVKQLADVNRATFRVDTKRLVAIISVGSDKLVDVPVSSGGISFVEDNVFQTYKPEDYTLLEQCNIDETLDLKSSYVISSNVIEDAAINVSQTHDDDIFFVDCENVVDNTTSYSSTAIEGDPFANGPPVFYNTRLMNNKVLERWSQLIPNNVVNYSGDLNLQFRAQKTDNTAYTSATITTVNPLGFDNDFDFPNFDGDGTTNAYGNGTAQGSPVSAANSRYTCQIDGEHIFYVQVQTASAGQHQLYIELNRFDSLNNFIQNANTGIINVALTTVENLTANFNCNAGDYIECRITIYHNPPLVQTITVVGSSGNTWFSCVSAPDSGGTFVTINNSALPIILADLEYPVANADFYDILANPFKRISFTHLNDTNYGWIDSFKFNHRTSIANITLLGTQDMLK